VVVVVTLHIVFFFIFWSLFLVFFHRPWSFDVVVLFLFLVFWSMVFPRVFHWFLLAPGSRALSKREEC
jgi:hypothetical protein